MAKILIEPDNIRFEVDSSENILQAGLNNKLNLPHGCKSGKCGACKCKVLSGEISLDTYNKTVLTDEELKEGYTLLCKAHTKNDIVLHIPHLLTGFPIKMLPSKVDRIVKTKNTAIITLKTPPLQQFGFYAGQYIDIILQGKNRSYSIASSPQQKGEIELHVRYHGGGIFSEFVWQQMQLGQIVRFKGPLGNFRLQESNRPVILVCTGTGFAPIKAIIEDMFANNIQREIYLFWGNRTVEDFYLLELLPQWIKKLNIAVTLCLSKEKAAGYENSYVTSSISSKFTELDNYEMYACGNIKMIEDCYELVTNKLNLSKKLFFSDAFTPSID